MSNLIMLAALTTNSQLKQGLGCRFFALLLRRSKAVGMLGNKVIYQEMPVCAECLQRQRKNSGINCPALMAKCKSEYHTLRFSRIDHQQFSCRALFFRRRHFR